MRAYISLWKTYWFIVVISFVTAFAMTYIDWLDIKSDARIELEYANKIVTRSIQQVFHNNEALLEILGERLIELEFAPQPEKAQRLVNDLLKKNSDLAGLGLADTSGQLVITSLNIDRKNLPNLLTTAETRASFKQAMNSDTMVIGRTYYMKALQQWVIPFRYRITDNENKVIAVMTTGIKIGSAHSLWSADNLPEYVRLSVIRSDFYLQYFLGLDLTNIDDIYNKALPQKKIDRFYRHLLEQTGHDADSLRASGKIVSVLLLDDSDEKILSAVSFDPIYGHYTFTSTLMSVLYARMLVPISWLIVLLLSFNITLYIIFKNNERILKDSKKRLEFQAKHDALTKLPNRRYLLEEFEHWKQAHDNSFSVLFIDLNDFKSSNDLHGHSVGDRILQKVVKRINSVFVDCMNVRQSGDEFIILCAQTDEKQLILLCKKFLEVLQRPLMIDELEFSIRASIGISCAPIDGNGIDELLRKADMAMYRAKKLKSDIYLYSKDLEMYAQRVESIEKALIHALEKKEFYLVYQPQIDSLTRSVVGVEALIRWKNPELGQVSPDEFICIAESSGLIHEIGKYVFETAICEIQDIYKNTSSEESLETNPVNKLRLSINVSVHQLVNDDFVNFIKIVLDKYNKNNIPIMIEVTESVFINDLDNMRILLEKIRQIGVGISLDDFGTGYSSLSILNKLPINELKIDKDFVKDILSDNRDWLLIKSIISLSKNLSIPVLAEGVENDDQANMLTENGCNLLQGSYFSKPLNKEDLTSFLLSGNKGKVKH